MIDPKSPCTFGEAVTPILGDNDVDFTNADLGDFENPVKFQLASWQVSGNIVWLSDCGNGSLAMKIPKCL